MIQSILVPLDGSELAERILTQVGRILRSGVPATLLRVVRVDPRVGHARAEDIEEARAYLGKIVAKIVLDGGRASERVVTGDPADGIIGTIRELSPDLVAMATHGRTGLQRWLRGSIAERVMRESPAPVLVANPFGLEKGERRFARTIVPLDGSETSAAILPVVHDLARLYDSEVVLQHVVEVPDGEYPTAGLVTSPEQARGLLETFATRLPGARVRVSTAMGSAAAAIIDTATFEHADLIALTTHGRTGIARWAYGSVAEQIVRHAPCPILAWRVGKGR